MGISKWLLHTTTMISTAVAIEEGSGDTESMKKVKTGVAIAYIHAMILIFIKNRNDLYKMCLPVDE